MPRECWSLSCRDTGGIRPSRGKFASDAPKLDTTAARYRCFIARSSCRAVSLARPSYFALALDRDESSVFTKSSAEPAEPADDLVVPVYRRLRHLKDVASTKKTISSATRKDHAAWPVVPRRHETGCDRPRDTNAPVVQCQLQRYADIDGGHIGESDVDVISIGVLFRF